MDENKTTQQTTQETAAASPVGETKFCKECGQKIAKKAVICPHCGCQVESMANEGAAAPQIVINNTNQNSNQNINQNVNAGMIRGKAKNKWVSMLLLIFLGYFGGHKFYEGKVGMGVLYIFTFGIFGIGLIVDFITLLFKPNPYYVV